MKQIYLTVALLCPALMVWSQNNSRLSIQNEKQKTDFQEQKLSQKPSKVVNGANTVSFGSIIGQTSYDLQSNYGTGTSRIQKYNDGRIAVVWTQSLMIGGGLPDRGTGYNIYDPQTNLWDSGATSWYGLNTVRTGWPQILNIPNKEYTLSHDFSVSNIVVNSRDTIGEGSWGISQGFALDAVWPRAVNVGDTIHMIAIDNQNGNHNGIQNPLKYFRSDDGGQNWSIIGYTNFPAYDNSTFWFNEINADAYALDANKNHVAFVVGGGWDPLILYKSDNYGEDGSWTRTIINTPDTTYAHVDNLNQRYVVPALSSEFSIVIDDDGEVHMSTTGMAISWYFGQDKPQNPNGLQLYNPLSSLGIYYWNESMGTMDNIYNSFVTTNSANGNTLYPVSHFHDYSGEGTYDIPDNANNIGTYSSGLAGHSNIALDQDSGIYMVWSQVAETTEDLLPKNYRDLYFVYSFDNGQAWSDPVNIASLEVFDDGFSGGTLAEEEVFPSTIKRIGQDDILHMIYQSDALAGMSVTGDMHTPGFSEIVYYPLDINYFRNISSVSEISEKEIEASIYPNPAKDQLFIELNRQSDNLEVEIFNLIGNKVSAHAFNQQSGLSHSIDLSDLDKGIYILRVVSEDYQESIKFVKQ